MTEPVYFKETFSHHLVKITEKFIFVFLVILMFDELLEMFLWIVGHFFELFEYSLDQLAEHFLHASDSQSEMISFYFIFAMMLGLLVFLYRIFPRLLVHFEQYLEAAWKGYKRRSALYWHHLSWLEKIELSMTYVVEISFILFWLTM